MAITYIEIEDRYRPTSADQPIEVSVRIGDAQTGGYLIFLDKDLKGANKNAKLGTAAQVIGKRTIVAATVVDELNSTNWTSVTVFIEEGNKKTQYGPYSKEASQHLDTISYNIKILNTNV